jgi:transcriptional regulator
MYVPQAFAETDTETLYSFIEHYSFGLLVTNLNEVPFATHLPFLLEREPARPGTLIGHMARGNPQWAAAAGQMALAVFSGPHAYISPSWYDSPEVVPTWNYVAVHAYGRLELVEDPDSLEKIVAAMVVQYEQFLPRPWSLGERTTYLERMLAQIVGFRLTIERLEGKWKLNQNHPRPRREKVIQALREQGGENSEEIARLMEQTLRGE